MNSNMEFSLIVNNEEVTFTEEEIVEEIKRIIKTYLYVTEDENGVYYKDIYVDYSDELNDDNIEAIVAAIDEGKDPLDAFYDSMDEFVMNCTMEEEYEFITTIKQNWRDDKFGNFYEYKEFIHEWVMDNVCFNFPYEHYLNTLLEVNLLIDIGDGNYDYTMNNFYGYNGEGYIPEDEEERLFSSVLWLVNKQGYTFEELQKAYEGEQPFSSNKFLKSVVEELENVTTNMNALTFFVKMKAKDFIELGKAKEYVTISKDTNAGLVDTWSGGGSLLDIQLEHDITIPVEFIKPYIDGYRGYGYSVNDIYGLYHDFWKDTVLKIDIK